MKLSVAIPIYNRSVESLLTTLKKQADKASEAVEIICLDDGSQYFQHKNQQIAEELDITYLTQPNAGRAKSRNKLANLSRGEYLLFLDCDSGVIHEKFLENYLFSLGRFPVLYGGRKYPSKKPEADFLLHWYYGKEVESAPLSKRLKFPYSTFMSNNFTVKKSVYEESPMDENLREYGYEDFLWAEKLREKGIEIGHLNNPVIHEDLCSNEIFLKKTIQALDNLAYLVLSDKLGEKATPLLRWHLFFKKWRMTKFFTFSTSLIITSIEKNLHSQSPNLTLFNLWKLYQYHLLFLKRKKVNT